MNSSPRPTSAARQTPARAGWRNNGAVRARQRQVPAARLTGPGIGRDVRIDRARLEAVTGHLLSRVVEATRETIEDAIRRGGERPDTIMLAGGANRMPMVGRALTERLGLDVRASEPHLAVVSGLVLARDFGLLFLTGQDGDPLTLPRARPARPRHGPEPRITSQETRIVDPEPQIVDPEPPTAAPEPTVADPEPRLSDPEPVAPVPADSSRVGAG